MYNLPYYKEKKSERLLSFMADHPFVVLSGSTEEGIPVATQVPVLLDEHHGRAVSIGALHAQYRSPPGLFRKP